MKMGAQTSECWISAITSVVGLLTAMGYMTSSEADQITKAVTALAGAAITIATTLAYVITRVQLKQTIVQGISDASTTEENPTTASVQNVSNVEAFHAAVTKAGV